MEVNKRYQVFVSSTYTDLQDERQQVMHALLEMNCIPSGMELFPAADESQWSLIQRVIQDCDYYVLIVAGRYGSCDADGMSYTEKEYRYAIELNKPVIAFLHKSPGQIPSERCEPSDEGKRKLEKFKAALVQQQLCKYWDPATGLAAVVITSLLQLETNKPQVGWVRADALPTAETTLELLRLRARVDELETELARSRTTAPEGTEQLAQGDETREIHYSFHDWDHKYGTGEYNDVFSPTWNSLFSAIAPTMINEASEGSLKRGVESFVANSNRERYEKLEGLGGHDLGSFNVSMDDFQTVKVQLRALGLIVKSVKPHGIKDTGTYWTLTPYGDQMMTRLRAIRRIPATGQEPQSEHTGGTAER